MSERSIPRRTALQRLAVAAWLPLSALGAPIGGACAGGRSLTVPEGAFRLERVLSRELGDGAAIVVTRRWRIGFAPSEPGIRVSGEQTFADVAAPAALAPLAALEKARSTAQMFPIRLDGEGHIAGSDRRMDAADLLRAIEAGQAWMERNGAGGATAASEARKFMAQLARMGAEAVSVMPRDLFFPAAAQGSATRDLALPGGETGTISVTTQASVHARTGLLQASERVIVTRVRDSARTSREDWALTPL